MVIFDLLCTQPIGSIKYHGGGEYTKAVFVKYLEIYSSSIDDMLVCYNFHKYMDENISNLIMEYNIKSVHVDDVDAIYTLLEKEAVNSTIHFYTGLAYPYYKNKFPRNVVSIGTCHGLRDIEKLNDDVYYNYVSIKAKIQRKVWMKFRSTRFLRVLKSRLSTVFNNFDYIIAVSEHTTYSIKVNFPEENHKSIIITYNTPAKDFEIKRSDISESGQYIMLISADRWLKNAYSGVMAIDDLYSKGYLVSVRTRVYGNLPDSIIHKLKNVGKFDFFPYVESSELEMAFKDCSLLLYPTLNEGYGLPPFEAMKYGKTCIISAVCSLPEIYKDAVYYCNPYDQMEIENRILQAVDSKIPLEVVLNRVKEIKEQQTVHTMALCKLINTGTIL